MTELDVVFVGADASSLAEARVLVDAGKRVMVFDGCRCLAKPLEEQARCHGLRVALDEAVLAVIAEEGGLLVRTAYADYRAKSVITGRAPGATLPATSGATPRAGCGCGASRRPG